MDKTDSLKFYLRELAWKKSYEQENRLDDEILRENLYALFSKDKFINYDYFQPADLKSSKFYEKVNIWFYLKWINYFPKSLKGEHITSFYKNGIHYIARKFENCYVLKLIGNSFGRDSFNSMDNYVIKQRWSKINNYFARENSVFEKNYIIEVDDLEKEWKQKLDEIIENIGWTKALEKLKDRRWK